MKSTPELSDMEMLTEPGSLDRKKSKFDDGKLKLKKVKSKKTHKHKKKDEKHTK